MSDKSTIITKPESDVSQVTQFIDSLNNKLETENKIGERQDITEDGQSDDEEEEVEEDQESDDEEDEVEEDQESDDASDGEEVEEDQESDDEEDVEEDQESDDASDGEEVEFEIIKIKKKQYYISNEEPPGIYAIESDDDVGDRIGDFIDNKLVKSTD